MGEKEREREFWVQTSSACENQIQVCLERC